MATVINITHESGPPVSDHWTVLSNGVNTITAASALNGTSFGLETDFDALGAGDTKVLEKSFAAISTNEFRIRFWIDLNNLSHDGSPPTVLLFDYFIPSTGIFRILVAVVNLLADTFYVQWSYVPDGAGVVTLSPSNTIVPAGENCIEMRVVNETSDGAADGIVEGYLNGALIASVANAEIFNRFDSLLDEVRFRVTRANAAITGQLYTDEFIVNDDASVALCPAFTPTIAPMTRPADIDADGSNLYIALLNSGVPILVKMSTALDADGSTVFEPGAGDDIGVQCGRFDNNVVWVAGAFDGTNVVEKSEDAGSSFTVKDPATFGDVEAFIVGPDSDDRVLIADDNIDIQETIDSGTIWTAKNSGTGFNVNAIARFSQSVEESVFGNDAGASDNINYSPNSGDDMEDFSSGFPTEDATGVIVN